MEILQLLISIGFIGLFMMFISKVYLSIQHERFVGLLLRILIVGYMIYFILKYL